MWTIEYFETQAGSSPVFKWIEAMPEEEQAVALWHIEQLAILGLEAQMPMVRPLGGKLYELRWEAGDKQQRVAYFAAKGKKFVLLHGFTKKQENTPKKDKDLASKRMLDYRKRNKG